MVLGACVGPASDDTDTDEPAIQTVRLMSWNVQELGTEGSAQYLAAQDIIRRLDADIVALNEVEEYEIGALNTLASELGYSEVFVPNDNPFGSLRNAIISRFPMDGRTAHTAPGLSGDASANDLTRLPIEAQINLPGVRTELVVISQHWKAGSFTDDAFRRVVDGQRTAQVALRWRASEDWVVVMGDVNAEIDDVPETPIMFTAIPNNLPSSYRLGEDLEGELSSDGLMNDPFAPLQEQGFSVVDATQADGRDATRPSSDRRLDYVFVSDPIRSEGTLSEVYDSKDEHLSEFPKAGSAPDRAVSETASDHLPIVVEFVVSD